MSAQTQDLKPTRRLPPYLPASLRIAATSTTLEPMPTMVKQQKADGTTEAGEDGDAADEEHDDVGEILASMSRADALRLHPTAMENVQGSPPSTLTASSQSVFPVIDSKANEVISYANGASECGLSSSTITFLIFSLVVICIEIIGRFVF
jgi:hypothetical protein